MTIPIPIEQLSSALDLGESGLVSLVGGGGKTTALFALGRQLAGSVVLSTTTKMGSDRDGGYEPLVAPSPSALARKLDRDRVVLAWRAIVDHRALGFDPETCAGWLRVADHVVVEADGSRRRPFKAPADHEPVVPVATSVLIACVGAAAFGRPIEAVCHRPERVAALAGCAPTAPLVAERLARVLLDPEGSQKHRPESSGFVVLLNQVTERDADYVTALERALDGAAPVVAVAPFAPADSPELGFTARRRRAPNRGS